MNDKSISHQNDLEIVQDKFVKQIASQNDSKSINNQTYGDIAGKMTPFPQSSIRV